jgi:hypothetical protein
MKDDDDIPYWYKQLEKEAKAELDNDCSRDYFLLLALMWMGRFVFRN